MKTYVFTNRVYPPVAGATGELLRELAEGLAAGGSRVVVVTSRRDQGTKGLKDEGTKGPKGEEGKGLKDQGTKGLKDEGTKGLKDEGTKGLMGAGGPGLPLQDGESVNGVEIIRVGTAPFTRASHWRRAMSYALLYPQLMWQVWKLGRVDAVVSMTDPPLQLAAVALASGRAAKRIHWAQDIYPELAEELGVIGRGGLFARVLRSVSTWALRKQDEVVVVGRCMRERLIARGVDARSIEIIPNWSPIAEPPEQSAASMRRRMGWGDGFVALYSGNLGLAHDFTTLAEAAKMLPGSRVRMVFAGEGPRLQEVKAATAGSDNVSFIPPQPKEDLAAFLAAADLHLVTVRENLGGLVVPSKIYGILAAGRPVVCVGPAGSEVARILEESGAGISVNNGDAAALAAFLKDLAANPAGAAAMGGKARVAAKEFTFAKALEKWREILET